MLSTKASLADITTEVVQVIRGGEPDEDGVPLAGRISPFAPNLNERTSACICAPLPYSLWETLASLNAFADDSGIWLRVLTEDENPPLPEGSVLITTKQVSFGVA